MRRGGTLLVLALGLTPAGLAAQAQVTFDLSDSVFAVPVTKPRSVELDLYTGCSGLSSYSVTLFVDRARVHLARADSVPGYGFPAPAIDSSVADQYTLTASGGTYAWCKQPLALLTLDVGSTTASGSLVSARLNTAVGYATPVDLTPGYRAGVMDVCQADQVSGDVDQNLTVNSRDALIALTASVGLPVSGPFNLNLGDVDGDKQVTSRDALFILSAGIGLGLPYGVTAGMAIPARCAPLAPAPADLLFFSDNGMERIAAGDTVRAVIPLSLGANQASSPRWAPDGSRLAYECLDAYPYNQSICTVNPDGTGLVDLQVAPYNRANAPDWSPDGTKIAFIKNGYYDIFVADANGANVRQVTSGLTLFDLAWSPDGSRIAFTGYNVCCSTSLYVINVDGTNLQEVFPSSYTQSPARPSWSGASDSLVYYNGNYGRAYEVAASGSSTAGSPVSPFLQNQYQPDWSAAGVGFGASVPSWQSLFYHRAADGRQLRLTRPPTAAGDRLPDFRRTAGVYVSSVTLSLSSDTLATTTSTVADTATVTNSDASTNTTAVLTWVSRNTGIATVASTGSRTANITGVATGSTYIVVTVGGWRSDSLWVTVP